MAHSKWSRHNAKLYGRSWVQYPAWHLAVCDVRWRSQRLTVPRGFPEWSSAYAEGEAWGLRVSWVSCHKNLNLHSVSWAVGFLNWRKLFAVTSRDVSAWDRIFYKQRENNSDRSWANTSVILNGCQKWVRGGAAGLEHKFCCFWTL